ncbi:MAG: acyl-ACP--UDP-N-acetylglucosamine O-acyltransferase [Rhodospirillales bacterium]|nr:MAG: acyl-ACP--UDP-N-acetylglucosamine O-acyltransferase [Rhodospirillales bacterium]
MAEIHSSAAVGVRVSLGADVHIGPGAVVEDDVELGDRVAVGPHAFIGRLSVVGPDTRIGLAAMVGGDPQIIGWTPVDSRVVIGSGTTIREYASVHRAKAAGDETVVGDGCYLMASSHVAHDCRLGEGVTLVNGALLAGHVEVGDHAFISGNCVVHQFVRIGRRVMVRGMTALGKDVVPFVLVDQTNTVRSLNKVGLRRAGLSLDALKALDRAFREIFRSSRPVRDALTALEAQPMTEEVREMVDFIRASKRGICLTYSTQVQRLQHLAADDTD